MVLQEKAIRVMESHPSVEQKLEKIQNIFAAVLLAIVRALVDTDCVPGKGGYALLARFIESSVCLSGL